MVQTRRGLRRRQHELAAVVRRVLVICWRRFIPQFLHQNARALPQQRRFLLRELGLTNLKTFPWIAEPVEAGRIALHGMHFGIAEGRLARLDPETDTFVTVGTGAAALQG